MQKNKNMKIEYVNTSDLIPYANNAKIHDEIQIEQIKQSIKSYGFNDPVAVWKNNEIIEGHGRVLAAKDLGIEQIPIIRLENLSDKQRREYMLVHNQLTMNTGFDAELLDAELQELDFDEFDYGFEKPVEFDEPTNLDDEREDNYQGSVPEQPKSKLGDIYELGNHRLICGDCTDKNVIDKLMNGEKADMVFTDPPYNLQTEGGCKGSIGKSLKKQGKDIEFIADFNPSDFLNVLPIVFNGNMNAYIFCNKELLPDYLNWCKNSGYSWNVLIWKKPTAIPIGDSHRPDIEYLLLFRKNALWNNGTDANYSRCLQYDRVKKGEENGNHPTPKPIELIANELKISSNKNSVVVDFFGGSGSTLIACEQLNRRCFMCELDPKYVDVIVDRWEKLTGRKARKIS